MATLASRLTVSVVTVVACSLAGFSLLLYSGIQRALIAQFDARLADDAHALANMVEERAAAPWELEVTAFAEFQTARAGGYYQLWLDDGTVLSRSPSLGGGDLSRDSQVETVLPDGRSGRSFVGLLAPRRDEDSPAVPTGRRLSVAVARSTERVDAELLTLRLLLLACGLTTLAVAGLASRWAIRRGLRPVLKLAERIDAIDEKRLTDRLPLGGLPAELTPVVSKLNALLGRLDASFSREREFTSDASHELRTPIAGLRSILEVTASRERSAAEYQAAVSDALAVTRQLTGLVETLLLLARLETPSVPTEVRPFALRSLVDECLAQSSAAASARRLTVRNEVPEGAVLSTDLGRLRLVIANLLSNAIDYTAEGGQVVISSALPDGIWLEVRDSGPPIPVAALPRIFERFFRADPSRTGEHHGLGLAVVRGVCAALGASVTADNRPDGWVAFVVAQK